MSSTATSFEDVLIRTGIMGRVEARAEARGQAEGAERKALDIAENLANMGIPLETVVAATKLDAEKVKALYKN